MRWRHIPSFYIVGCSFCPRLGMLCLSIDGATKEMIKYVEISSLSVANVNLHKAQDSKGRKGKKNERSEKDERR